MPLISVFTCSVNFFLFVIFFNQALEAIDEVGDILQLKYSKQTQKK